MILSVIYCAYDGWFLFSFVYVIYIYIHIASQLYREQIKSKLGNNLYLWMIVMFVHLNRLGLLECRTMTLNIFCEMYWYSAYKLENGFWVQGKNSFKQLLTVPLKRHKATCIYRTDAQMDRARHRPTKVIPINMIKLNCSYNPTTVNQKAYEETDNEHGYLL